MKRIAFQVVMLLSLLWPPLAKATVVTKAVGGSTCPGVDIVVPITVTDLNGVSAISLVLQYDDTKISYEGYQDVHDSISGDFFVNVLDGRIYMSWYNIIPANVGTGTLLNLRFEGISGTSPLTWDVANCDFANESGAPIAASYTNGTVTVYAPPAITSQPRNVSVVSGQNAVFSLSATGHNISYQWQVKYAGGRDWNNLVNNTQYSNVTTNQMTVRNVTMAMNGDQYRCVVSGTCQPAVVSNAATLTVSAFIPTIVTSAGSTTSCPQTVFTIPITVTNCNNVGAISWALSYDTIKVTYMGYEDVNPALAAGQMDINADNGYIYFTWISTQSPLEIGNAVLIDLLFTADPANSVFLWNTSQCEYSNPSGNILPTSFTPGSVTVYYAPRITSNPVNRTINNGASTTFSITATGQGINYTWQVSQDGVNWTNCVNGTQYANVSTATLTVRSGTSAMDGNQYRCMVCGTCEPCVYSTPATLHVRHALITTTVSNVTSCPDIDLVATVSVTNFTDVGSVSLALSYDESLLTYDGYSDVNSALEGGNLLVNASNGVVYISWTSINGGNIGNGNLMTLHFTGATGTGSLSWLTGNCEYSTTDGTVIQTAFQNGSVTIYQRPTITGNPANRRIYETQNTTFSVSATGRNITYRWQVSTDDGETWSNLSAGGHYGNVTTNTLSVSNATLQMNGNLYRCVVSGTCNPEAVSNAAQLTVVVRQPIVTAENVTINCTGLITQNITFKYLNNVGSISLTLNYDTNYLQYVHYTELNPLIMPNDAMLTVSGGKINFVWMNLDGADFGNGTLLTLIFESEGGQSTNRWDTSNGRCEVSDPQGNVFNTTFNNGVVSVTPSCSFVDIDSHHWAHAEIQALCSRGLISGYNCYIMPDDFITRADLAKVAYQGLMGNTVPVSDYFPSPFLDLQNPNTYYYRYAKALSYLDYGNGVPAFDRSQFNFNPEGIMERIDVVKTLMEAYNVAPAETATQVFEDVPATMRYADYIDAAATLGIIDEVAEYFRPNDTCTRAEAFVWLEHILNNRNITIPRVQNTMNFQTSDFFIPSNYTPYNFPSNPGQEAGNYSPAGKPCFDIPGWGEGLSFEHFYNSYLTELPDLFFAVKPLGTGWSHTYNSFIVSTDEVKDKYGSVVAVPCLIVTWPDGTVTVYDNAGNPEFPTPITQGTCSVLRKLSETEYAITDKSQNVYVYEKISGSASDSPYMLVSIKDKHDNQTEIVYEIGENLQPRIAYVEDPSGRRLGFSYQSGTNYLLEVTDPMQRTVGFSVVDDNLISFTNANDDEVSYFYDGQSYSHLLDSIILPKGNTVMSGYADRKLVSTRINGRKPVSIVHTPHYSQTQVSYETEVKEYLNASTNVTSKYQFDRNGQIVRMTSSNDIDVSRVYSNPDDPTLLTEVHDNKSGISAFYEYDERENLTRVTTTAGEYSLTNEYLYDDDNQLVWAKDANGNETSYVYSDANLTRIVDALGNETEMTYGQHGQLLTVSNSLGITKSLDYDASGNCIAVSFPSQNVTATLEHDAAGRIVKATDQENHATLFMYDGCDNLVMETDPAGNITKYVYDKNDNLKAVVNALGDSTRFVYDFNSDLLLSEISHNISKLYTYNENGTLNTFKSQNGVLTTYQYDGMGRLTGDGSVSYSYDNKGMLKNVTKNNLTISYNYDALGRVSSVTYDGQSVGYSYDNNSNVTRLTYPGNLTVTYTYDALNQLKTVLDWKGNLTRYLYRNDGKVDSVLYPNMMSVKYDYDPAGRLTGMTTRRNDGTVIAGYIYLLDQQGNHLSESAIEPYMTYLPESEYSVSYSYDGMRRLLSDGVNQYQYDYNGNMTQKGQDTYSFDIVNNLTRYLGRNDLSFYYDGMKYRHGLSRNDLHHSFVLDMRNNQNILVDKVETAVQDYYVYGLGLLSRIKPNGNAEYFVYDPRGSVVAMVDDTEEATITHKYQYDENGMVLQLQESDFNLFRFAGKYGTCYDDSCLYYMHSRYYDPSIGRFISENPVWSMNLYQYANDNPVMPFDIPYECFDGAVRENMLSLGKGNALLHEMGNPERQANGIYSLNADFHGNDIGNLDLKRMYDKNKAYIRFVLNRFAKEREILIDKTGRRK